MSLYDVLSFQSPINFDVYKCHDNCLFMGKLQLIIIRHRRGSLIIVVFMINKYNLMVINMCYHLCVCVLILFLNLYTILRFWFKTLMLEYFYESLQYLFIFSFIRMLRLFQYLMGLISELM